MPKELFSIIHPTNQLTNQGSKKKKHIKKGFYENPIRNP